MPTNFLVMNYFKEAIEEKEEKKSEINGDSKIDAPITRTLSNLRLGYRLRQNMIFSGCGSWIFCIPKRSVETVSPESFFSFLCPTNDAHLSDDGGENSGLGYAMRSSNRCASLGPSGGLLDT